MTSVLCLRTAEAPQRVLDALFRKKLPSLVPIELSFFSSQFPYLVDETMCTDEFLQIVVAVNLVTPDNRMLVFNSDPNYSVAVCARVNKGSLIPQNLEALLRTEVSAMMDKTLSIDVKADQVEFTHFVADSTTEGGRRTLGILYIHKATDAEVNKLYGANMTWLHIDKLALDSIFLKLDNWSRAIVGVAKSMLEGWQEKNPQFLSHTIKSLPYKRN